MIVATGVDILKPARFMKTSLCVGPVEEKALDFVGGVERVSLFFMQAIRVALEDAADVCGIRCAVFIDHMPENQDFSRAEDIGWRPVKSAPIHAKPKIALALRG